MPDSNLWNFLFHFSNASHGLGKLFYPIVCISEYKKLNNSHTPDEKKPQSLSMVPAVISSGFHFHKKGELFSIICVNQHYLPKTGFDFLFLFCRLFT